VFTQNTVSDACIVRLVTSEIFDTEKKTIC
jgi:hypothetical protein